MSEKFQMQQITNSLIAVDPAAVAAAEAAKARIQAAYIIALQKPRKEDQARARILKACKRLDFAEDVEFKKPVGRKQVKGKWEQTYISGLSIRFAEVALKEWENILAETQTLYEDENIRRIRVSVIDLEANTIFSKEIQISKTVERRNKKGREVIGERINTYGDTVYIVKATDDELMNKENALISKTIRNEGLRLIPNDIKEEAKLVARKVVRDNVASDPDQAKKSIVDAFASINVWPNDLEQYLEHSLNTVSAKEIDDLRKIYKAISDGESSWSEYVTREPDEPKEPQPGPKDEPQPSGASGGVQNGKYGDRMTDLDRDMGKTVEDEIDNLFAEKMGEHANDPMLEKAIQASVEHFNRVGNQNLTVNQIKESALQDIGKFTKWFLDWKSRQTPPDPSPKSQAADNANGRVYKQIECGICHQEGGVQRVHHNSAELRCLACGGRYTGDSRSPMWVDKYGNIPVSAKDHVTEPDDQGEQKKAVQKSDEWDPLTSELLGKGRKYNLKMRKAIMEILEERTINFNPAWPGAQLHSTLLADEAKLLADEAKRQINEEHGYDDPGRTEEPPPQTEESGKSDEIPMTEKIAIEISEVDGVPLEEVTHKMVNKILSFKYPSEWQKVMAAEGYGMTPVSEDGARVWNEKIVGLVEKGKSEG